MYRHHQYGFSLVELVVSVGIISILLSVTLVAVNPAVQFARANDTRRQSDITQLYKAFQQYQADNRGAAPPGMPINTSSGAVQIAKVGSLGLDLCPVLVPKYMPALPVDPVMSQGSSVNSCASDYNTYYSILFDDQNKFSIFAEGASPRLIAGISVDRPYLHYRFDNGAGVQESEGVSHYSVPATGIQGTMSSATGKYLNGLNFNGTDGYVQLVSPADSAFSARDQTGFSVAAWVNLDSGGSGTRVIYAERNDNVTTRYRVALYVDASNMINAVVRPADGASTAYSCGDGGNPYYFVTSAAITPNTWYHVALTYAEDVPSTADQKLILYINGSPVTNTCNPTTTTAFAASIYTGNFATIGASPWGGDLFHGVLDDLRIYRYARTEPEISNDMNNIP